MKNLGPIIFGAGLLLFGTQCLRHASVVQANAIDEEAERPMPRSRLGRELRERRRAYLRSNRYLRTIRIIGVGTLLMGLFLIAVMLIRTPS